MLCYVFCVKIDYLLARNLDSSLLPIRPFLGAGMGADPSRPPCRKAKDLRKERRLQKEQMRQHADGVSTISSPNQPTSSQNNQPKFLEEFINESLPDSSSHCLEVSRSIKQSAFFSLFMGMGINISLLWGFQLSLRNTAFGWAFSLHFV